MKKFLQILAIIGLTGLAFFRFNQICAMAYTGSASRKPTLFREADGDPSGRYRIVEFTSGSMTESDSGGTVLINIGAGGGGGGGSPNTTKGDLHGFSDTDVRIPVGTPNQMIIANPDETSGIKWVDQSDSNVSNTGDTMDGNYIVTGTLLLNSILQSNGDMTFEIDADDNGSNSYIWTDGTGTIIATLTEAGAFQIADDMIVSGGDITFGNIAARIGDGATDSITLNTDGTGDGEVVLPDDSIGGDEIDWANMTDLSANGVVDNDSHSHNTTTIKMKMFPGMTLQTPDVGDTEPFHYASFDWTVTAITGRTNIQDDGSDTVTIKVSEYTGAGVFIATIATITFDGDDQVDSAITGFTVNNNNQLIMEVVSQSGDPKTSMITVEGTED